MDKKPTTDCERNESYRSVTEYFLSKLKRVDDELNVTNAELREVLDEIRTKDSRAGCLKSKLGALLREESKKKMKELESTKVDLNALCAKADKVLASLGLIWVGENNRSDPMACCTSTNENYVSLKRVPPLRKNIAHDSPSHYQPNKPKTPVVPFSGVGYRLGTGSEVYGYEPEQSAASRLPDAETDTAEKIIKTSNPVVGRRHSRAKTSKPSRATPVETVSPRFSSVLQNNEIEGKINVQPKFRRAKSLEELPVELLMMSTNERRRALKQMSVQIQKNMNKYFL